MAASNGRFKTADGKTIHVYFASSGAVNTYLNWSIDHVALSTDLTELTPTRNNVITDLILGTAPATGEIQLEEDGMPLPYSTEMSQHLAALTTRAKLYWPLQAGHKYRFKVITVLPA